MAYTRQAPESRATVNDARGAGRNGDVWLGAAVIAMGLLAGLNYDWAVTVMPAAVVRSAQVRGAVPRRGAGDQSRLSDAAQLRLGGWTLQCPAAAVGCQSG